MDYLLCGRRDGDNGLRRLSNASSLLTAQLQVMCRRTKREEAFTQRGIKTDTKKKNMPESSESVKPVT